MRIITVNLPEETINSMHKLTKEYKMYPSRSELIRVAVREFLIKELQNLDKYIKYAEGTEQEPVFVPPYGSGTIDMRTVRFIRNLSQE
ncbi:MAG: ribbon-helix-helix domain-containing protein [Promethearchaeota archaeon]